MALWLAQGQRGKIQKIEYKENYTQVNFSTSRKDGDAYKYSDWGFARLVGKAHQVALGGGLKEKDVISIKSAFISKEAYLNGEGQRVYPKSPQVVIFDLELYRSADGGTAKPQEEVPDEDSIPF